MTKPKAKKVFEYGWEPIDRVAARVVRKPKKKKPGPKKLREIAAKTKDPLTQEKLLTQANNYEKNMIRAEEREKIRLIGKAAEEKARLALIKSKWSHDNE